MPLQVPSGEYSNIRDYAAFLAEQLDTVRYAIRDIEREGRTPNPGEMEAFEEHFRRNLADFESFLMMPSSGSGGLAMESALAMAEFAIMTGIGLEEPFHLILEDYPNAETVLNEVWGADQLPGRDRDFTHTPRIDRLLPERAEQRMNAALEAAESAPAEPPTLEGLREQAASRALAPAEPTAAETVWTSASQRFIDRIRARLETMNISSPPLSVQEQLVVREIGSFIAGWNFQALASRTEQTPQMEARLADVRGLLANFSDSTWGFVAQDAALAPSTGHTSRIEGAEALLQMHADLTAGGGDVLRTGPPFTSRVEPTPGAAAWTAHLDRSGGGDAPAASAELPSGVQAQLDNVETSLRERGGPRRPASLAFVDFLADPAFQAVLETSEDLQNQVRRMIDLVDDDFWEESGDYIQALDEATHSIGLPTAEGWATPEQIATAEPAAQEPLTRQIPRDLMSRIEVLDTRLRRVGSDESTHLQTFSDLNDIATTLEISRVDGHSDPGDTAVLTNRIVRVLDEMHPRVREIYGRADFHTLDLGRLWLRAPPLGESTPAPTPAAPALTELRRDIVDDIDVEIDSAGGGLSPRNRGRGLGDQIVALDELNAVAHRIAGLREQGFDVTDFTNDIIRILDEMPPEAQEFLDGERNVLQALATLQELTQSGRSVIQQEHFDQLVPELQRVMDNEPELLRQIGPYLREGTFPSENMQRFLADYFSMTIGDDEYVRLIGGEGNAPRRWSRGSPLNRYFVIREREGVVPVVRTSISLHGESKIYLGNLENMAGETLRKMGGTNAALRALSGILDRENITVGGSPGAFNDAGLPTGDPSDAGRRVEDLPDYHEGHGPGHPSLHWFYARLGFDAATGERAPQPLGPPPTQTSLGDIDPVGWNRKDFISGAVHSKRRRIAEGTQEVARATAVPAQEDRWKQMQQRELEKMDPAARARHEAAQRGISGTQQVLPGIMTEGPAQMPEGYEPPAPPAPPEAPTPEAPTPGLSEEDARRIREEMSGPMSAEEATRRIEAILGGGGDSLSEEERELRRIGQQLARIQRQIARGEHRAVLNLFVLQSNFDDHGWENVPESSRPVIRRRMQSILGQLPGPSLVEYIREIRASERRDGAAQEALTWAENELSQRRNRGEPPSPGPQGASGGTTDTPLFRTIEEAQGALLSGRGDELEALGNLQRAQHAAAQLPAESPEARRAYTAIAEATGHATAENLNEFQRATGEIYPSGSRHLPQIQTFIDQTRMANAQDLMEQASRDLRETPTHAHQLMNPLEDLRRAELYLRNVEEGAPGLDFVRRAYGQVLGSIPDELMQEYGGIMRGRESTPPEVRSFLRTAWLHSHFGERALQQISGRLTEAEAEAEAEPAAVAEPAPAAELPVAAAPEGRTVEIPDFLRDTTQTVSVPEAMDQVRGFLGDAVDESQEYFRADSLFMADQTLRALYPVVGQNWEIEELSSQYRDQLARVPVEEIRESAARHPPMEEFARQAIQARQLTQHADVIERELRALLREEPLLDRSPETTERVEGLRESRESLEDARGKLGRATPWLIGAALKGGAKPGVAQAEEMGAERPRVEARREVPPPVEAPASQKPPRPLPAAEPTPGAPVALRTPPGPDAPPPKAGAVEPVRTYEMPRGAKEAPAVRQAQTAADAIRAKAPELARSPDVMEVVQKGDRMMQHARKLEETGKHAEALRYREAARLNFQSLERLAKLRGVAHTAGRALGYASLPIIALDAYGMTTQAMEEGPAAVGRQIAEGAEETGRAVGRVLLPKAAEEAIGLDKPGTLQGEEIREQREQTRQELREEPAPTKEEAAEAAEFLHYDPSRALRDKWGMGGVTSSIIPEDERTKARKAAAARALKGQE